MEAYEIYIICILGVFCLIALYLLILTYRDYIIHRHHSYILQLVSKKATGVIKKYPPLARRWRLFYDALEAHPTPKELERDLTKWTYKQLYGDLENKIKEIENSVAEEYLMKRLESREAKK